MTSSEVLSPPPPAAYEHAHHHRELPVHLGTLRGDAFVGLAQTGLAQTGDAAALARKAWRLDAGKLHFGLPASMLDLKAPPEDVVKLDKYVQPVDRGPAVVTGPDPAVITGPDPGLLRSWQYQVSGKLAVAKVLREIGVEHIKSGGPAGMQAEAVKHITQHQMEDTFYMVDLGNVTRMFKVRAPPMGAGGRGGETEGCARDTFKNARARGEAPRQARPHTHVGGFGALAGAGVRAAPRH